MEKLPDTIRLGPIEEAERLWKGALDAHAHAGTSLVSLCESLDLGIHAAEILAIQRLQQVKDKFPGTIAMQLETPTDELDVMRDAVTEPKSLQFNDVVDLLSEESADCVAPRLHRGWEDRRFSCRRSRATAHDAIPLTIDGETRDKLLLLAAYRNRIFRYPPPLRIVTGDVLDAFGALEKLVGSLKSL